jgi:uncharacterized peroxidase-related enzyme
MSWIDSIPFEKSSGTLRKLYNRVKGPSGNIDNILLVHSLRPHTLFGHMALYKNVLHNEKNTIPKWFLETIGVYVSQLNRCNYCVKHHLEGLKKLLGNDDRFTNIELNLQSDLFFDLFDNKFREALNYSKLLTTEASTISKSNIDTLIEVGFSQGEILELNQVIAYFNYANRTVLGLGVSAEGDILGLSPNNDGEESNWTHK